MMSKFKIFGKVISIVLDIFFLLLFVYLLIFLPVLVGYKPFVMVDDLDEIHYPVGALLYYHKLDIETLHPDDVVVQKEGNNYQLLVVTDADKEHAYVGGDIGEEDAISIPYKEIDGKVSGFYIPYLGYYVSFLSEHKIFVYIMVIILIADFFIGSFINKLFTATKKKFLNM